jgi:hypothetical protein
MDPNNVLSFRAYVVASWLQSSRPCSLRTALTNRRLKTNCSAHGLLARAQDLLPADTLPLYSKLTGIVNCL